MECVCGEQNIKNGHYGQCKKYKEHLKRIEDSISKEFLIENYIHQGKSAGAISAELGLIKSRIIFKKLKEFNICIRTGQAIYDQQHRIQLAKKTSLERYGVEYHFQTGSFLLEKSKNIVKNKYGVDNVFQLDETKEKMKQTSLFNYGVKYASQSIEFKNKVKETCIKKYGVDSISKHRPFIEKGLLTKLNNPKNTTPYSIQSQTVFWEIYNKLPKELQEHCYFATLNKEFGKHDNIHKRYYYYDFVITNIKYCIEYNGNYYHANPEIYESDFYNKHLKLTSEQIWEKDQIKIDLLNNLGFATKIIWENEQIDYNTILNDILNLYNCSIIN